MMEDEEQLNKSSESVSTLEDYEFVEDTAPKLEIAGEGGVAQLKMSMQEILGDEVEGSKKLSACVDHPLIDLEQKSLHDDSDKFDLVSLNDVSLAPMENQPASAKEKVLQHKLSMYTLSPSPTDEDLMSISANLDFGEYTVFDGMTYLGCAVVTDPTTDTEVRRLISVLNEQSSAQLMHVSVSLPLNSEGHLILYEQCSCNELTSFPILQIKNYVAGLPDSREANCLALVHEANENTMPDTVIFQCHVFRCEVPEAVSKIIQCLTIASKKPPKPTVARSESSVMEKAGALCPVKNNVHTYVFEATLEFKEEDSKGTFSLCPKDKDYFKLRCKLDKTVLVTVKQVSNNKELSIERCFGLLISPGRNVRNSDMQLIEMVSFSTTAGEKTVYTVNGLWDPNEPAFEILNEETPKDTRVYLTVAVDLVISGIQEPVRFIIETKAKLLPQNERFWYFTKKTLQEHFYLQLREVDYNGNGDYLFQVISIDSMSRIQRKKEAMKLNLANASSSRSSLPSVTTPTEADSESDSDEPLMSGTGVVSKDCTLTELEGWSKVLAEWRQDLCQRPKHLASLVMQGIPEALRGEVWQLLAGCHNHIEIVETYKSLINKDSPCESIIQRDINRTFPAHEQFKDKSGEKQMALLKICKAYSIYDPEIGYCQGLSFLVAALLLHMPEEQAFGVFLKIMFDYRIRDMFRNSFEELHLKFFQLQRLIQDQMPELGSHFEDLGIEVHMFASQWLLTLFTAKFPLNVVYFIIDLFLLNGVDVTFQVAMTLLMLSKKELLALDFEGVLRHFRITLPKKYRSDDSARQLMQTAVKVKVKKLKKYEKEYLSFKEQDKLQVDPLEHLKMENKRLLQSNLNLDRENDDLAFELVNIKLQLRDELMKSEDKGELLSKELSTTRLNLYEVEEVKKRLEVEVAQLKEMCRRELQRAESEGVRNAAILTDYKQICNQLSNRLEKEQGNVKRNMEQIKTKIASCVECCKYVDSMKPEHGKLLPRSSSEQDYVSAFPEADTQARELELELARTKLELVEAQCKNQDLTHQLNAAITEIQSSKSTWFQKTLSTIRDAGKKDLLPNREWKEPS